MITHRVIVSQSKLLATLIHEIEDELLVLAVFASKNVLALENGGVETGTAVCVEAFLDDALDVLAACHFSRTIISRSLTA